MTPATAPHRFFIDERLAHRDRPRHFIQETP